MRCRCASRFFAVALARLLAIERVDLGIAPVGAVPPVTTKASMRVAALPAARAAEAWTSFGTSSPGRPQKAARSSGRSRARMPTGCRLLMTASAVGA